MSSASFTCASWLKSVLGIQKKKKKAKSSKKGFYCEKETLQMPVPPFPASPFPSPQGGGSGMRQSLKTRS